MIFDRAVIVPALLAGVIILVVGTALLMIREASTRDLDRRVRAVVWGSLARPAAGSPQRRASLVSLLRGLGDRIRQSSRMYSEDDIAALEGMIQAGGYSPRQVLPILIGIKLVIMVLAPLVAVAYGAVANVSMSHRLMAVALSLPIGILGPEMVLRAIRRPYIKALERGMPDALDLLVVCAEAGMGLESSLEQVSKEMLHSNAPISSALAMLLSDLRVLPNRREAFNNFGRRSGVLSMRRLSTILGQSLHYGTPLGQALRSVAQDLRRDRLVKMEESAVKLPVKLVFPLILFILPSLFIVLAGSSFIRLIAALSH